MDLWLSAVLYKSKFTGASPSTLRSCLLKSLSDFEEKIFLKKSTDEIYK